MVPWEPIRWPLVTLWPHALAFWLLLVLTNIPEFRITRHAKAQEEEDRPQDRGTLRLVLRIVGGSFWLGLAAAIVFPAATLEAGRDAIFVAGLCSMAAGFLLRMHCVRTLGRFFVGTVHVSADQPVVERGPYRWIRHPAYSAAMLYVTGIGLSFTNAVSLLLLIVLPAFAYGMRIKAEEQAFLDTIGEPYRDYMRRTKRLVPWLL